MFAFSCPNSGVTYRVFLKILKPCATSTFQVKAAPLYSISYNVMMLWWCELVWCDVIFWWYDDDDDMMIWWYDDMIIWWYDDMKMMIIWWYDDDDVIKCMVTIWLNMMILYIKMMCMYKMSRCIMMKNFRIHNPKWY